MIFWRYQQTGIVNKPDELVGKIEADYYLNRLFPTSVLLRRDVFEKTFDRHLMLATHARAAPVTAWPLDAYSGLILIGSLL